MLYPYVEKKTAGLKPLIDSSLFAWLRNRPCVSPLAVWNVGSNPKTRHRGVNCGLTTAVQLQTIVRRVELSINNGKVFLKEQKADFTLILSITPRVDKIKLSRCTNEQCTDCACEFQKPGTFWVFSREITQNAQRNSKKTKNPYWWFLLFQWFLGRAIFPAILICRGVGHKTLWFSRAFTFAARLPVQARQRHRPMHRWCDLQSACSVPIINSKKLTLERFRTRS